MSPTCDGAPVMTQGFEDSSLNISLEIFSLALKAMNELDGAACSLPHASRSALNTAHVLFDDCTRLAHRLARATSGDNQEYVYLGAVREVLDALEPSALAILPLQIEGCPILLIVRRGSGTEDADLCTITVVNCSAAHMMFHNSVAHPPKMRFGTCLVLPGCSLTRLRDSGFWTVLWFATKGAGVNPQSVRYSPLEILYQLLLPFAADAPLDHVQASALASANVEQLPMRTPRRSKSAHYGVLRHALEYLLVEHGGLSHGEYRQASLLLRLQYLRLAQHDLKFVGSVCASERIMLDVACQQLAHKACKLGKDSSDAATGAETPSMASALVAYHLAIAPPAASGLRQRQKNSSAPAAQSVNAATAPGVASDPANELSAAELAGVRQEITLLKKTLDAMPGTRPGEAAAVPPLVLSPADDALRTGSIESVLGGSRLLPSPASALASDLTTSIANPSDDDNDIEMLDTSSVPTMLDTMQVLKGSEVIGIYL